MQLFSRFIVFLVLVPFLSAQANKVGLTAEFIESGAILEGRSPESAEMVCSGVLVGCNLVLTAAHCLRYRHVGENRFWFYLQHLGLREADRAGSVMFCESHDCPGKSRSGYDLALLHLSSPASSSITARSSKNNVEERQETAFFVGFGVKPPRLDNYNLKRVSPIRLSDCHVPSEESHSLCSGLDDESTNPCHKDSGGPLYYATETGERSLLGIAKATGLGCRVGQAVYNDASSPAVQAWLTEHIGLNEELCKHNTLTLDEFLKVPNGWLDGTAGVRELQIRVPDGLDELLVTMNHAPGAGSGETRNDFDLELTGPDNDSTSLLPYCDNTWKLLAVCRVPSPTQGTWKARVTRKNGEGHFQLVASGISR